MRLRGGRFISASRPHVQVRDECLKGKQAISAAEMKMAKQLVAEMSGDWDPDDYKDEFRHQVMKLVDMKVKAGKTETVIQPEEELPEAANVLDLTALLQRSLKSGRKPAGKPPAKATAAKKAPAKKAVAKTAAKKASAQKKAA